METWEWSGEMPHPQPGTPGAEQFEEPPFSDVMTSPEASPRPLDRFRHHHHYYEQEPEGDMGGAYVVRTEHRSGHTTQGGREQVFTHKKTEMSRWAHRE